jgi:hypothetical protein
MPLRASTEKANVATLHTTAVLHSDLCCPIHSSELHNITATPSKLTLIHPSRMDWGA